MNTLVNLLNFGQSYWLDNLTRKKIISGELKERVMRNGLRGITSNPSIFNKAISNSTDYDSQISALTKEGKTPEEIYDALTIKDVQDACDILKTVYDQSGGKDGFVSLEVAPYFARDTKGTIEEARSLFKAVNRDNCMIKIPGTREGIPAIEQTLYEGININITLLFSVERYEEVAKAYLRALERRISEGKTVDNVISVASIFISRIDVLTDQLIAQQIISSGENNTVKQLDLLFGKAGIATARLVYQRFLEIFSGKSWEKFREKFPHVQRPLWASTSTKNPLYDELLYVEELIGENTVNTLPDQTIDALADHGRLKRNSIGENLEEAKQLFAELQKNGIDINFVTQQLENEGIQKFADDYKKLISNLAAKRLKELSAEISLQDISYGKLEKEIKAAYDAIDEKQTARLLFAKNPYLWNKDSEQTKEIAQRLGWLTLPEHFSENVKTLSEFASEVREEGYLYAVLLGMGGSSLCSEVARETFETSNGYLQLFVLDNTAPEAILELEGKIKIEKTIFIVASKSGNTQETISFFHYFYRELEKKKINQAGKNFVAITDQDTPLAKMSVEFKFRKLFVNPADLGGRYSVLSDFGLVPMALMGIDISSFLSSARQMENSCSAVPAAMNPGISLGIVLGICQRHGRDKITFVLSSSISSFGFWVEQLLAESTGKEGRGLIPVNGESCGAPEVYSNDRLFIHMYLDSDNDRADEKRIKALEEAGHPVVRIKLENKIALGAEYYRWEIAAAIAGIVIGINPFDQPNVEESKKNTSEILKEWITEGSFNKVKPVFQNEDYTVYGGTGTHQLFSDQYNSAGDLVKNFMEEAKQGDYIAFLPYFMLNKSRRRILQQWREEVRDKLKVATTLLNGPRYLHSTGQLHKGGPNSGLYILFTGDDKNELPIPGQKFGFATLHQSQALGDFRSLDNKKRRVIRIHLGKDIDAGLSDLFQSIKNADKQFSRKE